jgi:hypothetical protein
VSTETVHPFEFVLSEAPGQRSREVVTLASGSKYSAGQVLAASMTGTGEKISGTGNGTVGSVTIGAQAQPGIYVLTCIAAAADAGTFSVVAPDGSQLPNLTVAAAYSSSHISLTVADGSTDWGVGAVIHVTVTLANYVALNPAGSAGAQTAAVICAGDYDATTAAQSGVVIARDAEVSSAQLAWPSGISAANKSIATQRLAARGITVR